MSSELEGILDIVEVLVVYFARPRPWYGRSASTTKHVPKDPAMIRNSRLRNKNSYIDAQLYDKHQGRLKSKIRVSLIDCIHVSEW